MNTTNLPVEMTEHFLHEQIAAPVIIADIEVLHNRDADRYFVRATSKDGAVGVATTNHRSSYLYPLMTRRIIPYCIGKDARDLPALLEGVYRHDSNYKLVGLPFWNSIANVEFALWDLLGQITGRSVGEMLGGAVRREIPIYLSSLRRDTTPEQEVAWLQKRLAETGTSAVKVKIGGRMSGNADAMPGRSENLLTLARATFGEDIAIYVDANGSYDSAAAIEVGKMLEGHGVGWFEEPCPWEEYDETKRVADALGIPVAGGEQDSSLPRWREMIENRGVDIVQPDPSYNGGFLRTLRVARMAEAAGLPVAPHSPKSDATAAYLLHTASLLHLPAPHMEFHGAAVVDPQSWFIPNFPIQKGSIAVPSGPGLGVAVAPEVLAHAERLA